MLSQAISISIHLASTVLLARLLSPNDYGTIAMVLAITAFAGLFRDLGLSSAAIQKKNLTDSQQNNLFWLNVAMGSGLTVLVASASPVVAWFYGKDELVPVTLALSLTFLIGSLGTQHNARLVREMRFTRQAAATISGSFATLAVAVSCAVQGLSYWSLVWANLAGAVTTTTLLFALSPFSPGRFKMGAGIRSMLAFGAHVTTFDIVNYLHRNLDNILIGKIWGTDALGLYSRAYQLLMFPITAIRGPINAVAFPAMSRLQKDPVAYRLYYRRTTQILAFGSMPLSAFLFVASSPLLHILLGPKWSGVSPIFSLLAITSFIQPVAGLRGNVLLSSGQGKRYVIWGVFNAAAVSIGFVIGVHWGVTGVAASYAIVNYAILYPSLLIAFKGTSLYPSDFFGPISIPAAASLAAAAVAWGFRNLGGLSSLQALNTLAITGIAFTATYLTLVRILPGGKDLVHRLSSMFNTRSRKAQPSSS